MSLDIAANACDESLKAAGTASHSVYPAYAPCSASWVDTIPSHWRTKRLKFLSVHGFTNGVFKKKHLFGNGVKLVNVFDIYQDDFRVKEQSLERVEVTASEQKSYAI